MNKLLIILPIIAVLLISGCTGEQTPAAPTTSEPSKLTTPSSSVNIKEFDITAKQFEFAPSTITVKKGDTVKLHIESLDVTHGFNLPEFGVNENLAPGKTADVEFVADKTGTFTFSCSVYCGSGHGGMKGQLIVEE